MKIKCCGLIIIMILLLSFIGNCLAYKEAFSESKKNGFPNFGNGVHTPYKNNLADLNKVNSPASSIIYVDNNTGENHYPDLRTAINNSKNGDTIYVEPGLYKGNGNTNITIDHDLTIIGNNSNEIGIDVNNTKVNSSTNTNNTFFSSDVVLDGEILNNFFTITENASLKLSNLTLTNASSINRGGAIVNYGVLTIDFTSFTYNLVVKNNTWNSNNDWMDEDYDSVSPDDLEKGYDDDFGAGGAIYSTNQLHILNSNFEGNIAGEYCKGGAIFNNGEKTDINNTLFKTNIADDGGGAIYSEKGILSIDYSTFELNSASTISSNGGGAIYAENNNINLQNSIFMSNIAYRSYGGAINNKDSSLTSSNNYFISNIADGGDGGAIYSLKNYKTSINGTLFALNNASADGGAIYHKASESFDLSNSVFLNDTANRGGATYFGDSEEINSINSSYINNSCSSEGGSLYNSNSHVNIESNEFIGGKSKKGGAIYSNDGTESSLNIKDSTLANNNAQLDGGSLYSSTNKMNIKNDILINNSAANNGGGFYLTSNQNSIDNSTFVVNAVVNNGGAIYNTGSDLDAHNSIFKANYAAKNGGAIESSKNLQLKQNNYEKNMAGKYGAVLFSTEDKPDEGSSRFSEDYAGHGGDHYYTQKQADNAPAIEIGILVADIVVTIILTVLAIISGGVLSQALIVKLGITVGSKLAIAFSIVVSIVVGLAGFGLVTLANYLFELVPEYKKFNERNPLLLPLITLAIVIILVVITIFTPLMKIMITKAFTKLFLELSIKYTMYDAIARGALAALNTFARTIQPMLQHIDDLIVMIIYCVNASAGKLNHDHDPPDPSDYETNNENQFFKGISFNYNGIEVYLKDYDVSNVTVPYSDELSGLCDFNFNATPKNSSYPMIYGKGNFNVMNHYMTMDLFISSDYKSTSIYSWNGYNSDLFN
jgi:predicted outer membrane repeat protein